MSRIYHSYFELPRPRTNLLILILNTLIMWFSCLLSGGQVHAASPLTSIVGNTVTGNASTQVIQPQPGGIIYGIQGGYTAGSNLFHSFSQFNVGAGDVAQFQTGAGPNTSIGNILGRMWT